MTLIASSSSKRGAHRDRLPHMRWCLCYGIPCLCCLLLVSSLCFPTVSI
jgi:hypothetical protein